MGLRMAILQFIAAVPLSIAHAEDCRNAMTQSELNDCAYEAYRKSDAELNALYKQITSRLKDDPKQAQLLVTAQRAWIAFRDAECAFVALHRGISLPDGSVELPRALDPRAPKRSEVISPLQGRRFGLPTSSPIAGLVTMRRLDLTCMRQSGWVFFHRVAMNG